MPRDTGPPCCRRGSAAATPTPPPPPPREEVERRQAISVGTTLATASETAPPMLRMPSMRPWMMERPASTNHEPASANSPTMPSLSPLRVEIASSFIARQGIDQSGLGLFGLGGDRGCDGIEGGGNACLKLRQAVVNVV